MRERVAAGLIVIALLSVWLWSRQRAENPRDTDTPVAKANLCSSPTVERVARFYVDSALNEAKSKEDKDSGCSALAQMFVWDIHYSDFEEKQSGCVLDFLEADPSSSAHEYLHSQRPVIEKLCPSFHADIDRFALQRRGTRALMSMTPEERAAINDAAQGR